MCSKECPSQEDPADWNRTQSSQEELPVRNKELQYNVILYVQYSYMYIALELFCIVSINLFT